VVLMSLAMHKKEDQDLLFPQNVVVWPMKHTMVQLLRAALHLEIGPISYVRGQESFPMIG